jgi:hypothetical protein
VTSVTRFFLLAGRDNALCCCIFWRLPKVDLGPLKNRTGFSVLQIPEPLKSGVGQAVICLTVAQKQRDYSLDQG